MGTSTPSGAAPATPDASPQFEKTLAKGLAAESLEWQSMLSDDKPQSSLKDQETPASYCLVGNPWRSATASYDSLHDSDLDSNEDFRLDMAKTCRMKPETSRRQTPSIYEGIEGIHRFIAECER